MSEAIRNHDLLRNLQDEIAEAFRADPQIAGPPSIVVIVEEIGTIEADIRKKLGPISSGGGAIVIHCPDQLPGDPKRPYMFGVSIIIECVEIPIVNRSRNGNNVKSERISEIVQIIMRNLQSNLGWCAFQRTETRSGKTPEGWLGHMITFTTETVYDTEEVG